MTRNLVLALAAGALIAGPAAAGTAKLQLAAKSPEQAAQDVWAAAQQACRKQEVTITLIEVHRACVKATYRKTLATSGNPKLAALANLAPGS